MAIRSEVKRYTYGSIGFNNSFDFDDGSSMDDSDSTSCDDSSDDSPPVHSRALSSSDDGLSMTSNSCIVAVEGEEYTVSIPRIPEDYGWCLGESATGSDSSTVAGNESDDLLGLYDVYTSVDSTCSNDKVLPETCEDLLFDVLGFVTNPLRQEPGTRNSAAADIRLSMLSNFSTAYNVVSISLSLHIMGSIYPMVGAEDSLCSSSLIAGMIVGQLAGGALGDVLGRHRAMTAVMFLQVSGAFFSAAACSYDTSLPLINPKVSIYQVIALWRFVLGLGAGGVYPLSATLTAESSHSPEDRGKAVALAFSCQGVGYLVVPVFAWLVVAVFGEYSDLSWRLILGFGTLPGIILTVMRVRSLRSYKKQMNKRRKADDVEKHHSSQDRPISVPSAAQPRAVPVSIVQAIKLEEDLFRKLLGTGGCWLLFDILFYGNTLFQPVVLSAAFGSTETVQNAAIDTSLISAMALPGYLVSVFAVGRQSPKYIQIQGFVAMGLLYLCIGLLFDQLSKERELLLLVYGSTFFFSNYGPNATSFMLPSMTFSKSCRSTLNGICAACRKAGALLGTIVFVAATDHFGQNIVFLACSVLAFAGGLLTLICVSSSVGIGEADEVCLGGDMNPDQRRRMEEAITRVPMKIVYSEPSLMDHFHADE